jgi:hypothetical protein
MGNGNLKRRQAKDEESDIYVGCSDVGPGALFPAERIGRHRRNPTNAGCTNNGNVRDSDG